MSTVIPDCKSLVMASKATEPLEGGVGGARASERRRQCNGVEGGISSSSRKRARMTGTTQNPLHAQRQPRKQQYSRVYIATPYDGSVLTNELIAAELFESYGPRFDWRACMRCKCVPPHNYFSHWGFHPHPHTTADGPVLLNRAAAAEIIINACRRHLELKSRITKFDLVMLTRELKRKHRGFWEVVRFAIYTTMFFGIVSREQSIRTSIQPLTATVTT